MYVKVFSPTVSSIELVKRAERRIRRARLYYMRYVFLPGMLLGALLKDSVQSFLMGERGFFGGGGTSR